MADNQTISNIYRVRPWRTTGLPLTLAVFALTGCDRGLPVRYVLPAGYRGAFVIKVDETRGQKLMQASGWIEVHVPQSGIVLVKDDGFLRRWHSQKAEFDNQTPIPEAGNAKALLATSEDKDCLLKQICFGSRGTDSAGVTYFYVGPLSEIQEFERAGLLHVVPGNRNARSAAFPVMTENAPSTSWICVLFLMTETYSWNLTA